MTRFTPVLYQFRSAFVHNKNVNYFPMHMAKGMVKLQQTLTDVDCIVEVHDARIPLSGRNPKFEEVTMVRPRLLLFNKVDLVEEKDWRKYEEAVRRVDMNVKKVLCLSCKQQDDKLVKKVILPSIMDVVRSSNRYHRKELHEYAVLVLGVPNVGKSSLINTLRNVLTKKGGKATAVGAKPGVTRSVMERIKVNESPRVYVLDTPGILPPSIPDAQVACKLALCANIPDTPFDLVHLADFLLFSLNHLKHFEYARLYDLPAPSDDINEVLVTICKKHNLSFRLRSPIGDYVRRPHVQEAAQMMLRHFRKGLLGRVCLDQPLLDPSSSSFSSSSSSSFSSSSSSSFSSSSSSSSYSFSSPLFKRHSSHCDIHKCK